MMDAVRRIVTQEASIPALRVGLLLFAIFGALAWARQRPRLAVFWLATGAFLGLDYWLIQVVAPFGLGTDPALTREWAQAGVNSVAEAEGTGFVIGTPATASLLSLLSLAGTPLGLLQVLPQMAVLLCLGGLLVLPRCLVPGRTTRAFAAGLVLGGGLWPGLLPYGAVLRDPSGFAAALLGLGLCLVVLARGRMIRKQLRRWRAATSLGLMGLASLGRAWTGGAEPGVVVSLLMITACVLLASRLRGFLRRISASSAAVRRLEALVLLGAFCGSGLLWWDPVYSVPGFQEARDGNEALQRPMEWIDRNVPRDSVVLSSPEYSTTIAALARRRVLFSPPTNTGTDTAAPLPEPFRRNRLFRSTLEGLPIARLAQAFSVTHLFLGPGEATPPLGSGAEEAGEPRLRLVPVYEDAEAFRVFLLAKK